MTGYDDAFGSHANVALVIWLTAIAAVLPARTRGVGCLALAVLLSRAHGYGQERIGQTITLLFEQRTAALTRLDGLEQRLEAVELSFGPDAEDATS